MQLRILDITLMNTKKMESDNLSLLTNDHNEQPEITAIPCFRILPLNYSIDFKSNTKIIYNPLSADETTTSNVAKSFVAAFTVVVTASILTALFPYVILQTINDDQLSYQNDGYSLIFFISFACWFLMSVVTIGAKFFCTDGIIMLRPSLDIITIIKLAILYGVGGLAIFYGSDRFNVPCHLRDPLSAAILPFGVICHMLFSSKVDSIRKLVSLAVVIIGLFICVDFQLWDEFSCPSYVMATINGAYFLWGSDNSIWIIVYLTGLGFLAIFYVLLDRTLKRNNSDYRISTILMSKFNTGKPQLTFVKTLVLCNWIQFFSWVTISVLFWTNLFSFVARNDSNFTLLSRLLHGFKCLFGLGGLNDCSGTTSGLIWFFAAFSAIFFVALVYLMVISMDIGSMGYITALVTFALPVNILFWSIFRVTDNFDGIYWSPKFDGSTSFTLVGLPVMIVGLLLYRHANNR